MADIDVTRATAPEQSDLSKEFARVNSLVEKIDNLMFYVVLILLVMVATMLVTVGALVWSAFQNQAAADESLRNQLQSLSQQLSNPEQTIQQKR
ncbi:MAG TPA: hypothetical protein VMU25_03990 [Candidatus Paceibacterota bacterium]|nr:hypothetical protein [Candidatus Paceibacterota bacterium]